MFFRLFIVRQLAAEQSQFSRIHLWRKIAQSGLKIKPIIANGLGYRAGNQVRDAKPCPNALANLRGRYSQGKALDRPSRNGFGKGDLRQPGPGNHQELSKEARSAASRHFGRWGTWSAPTR